MSLCCCIFAKSIWLEPIWPVQNVLDLRMKIIGVQFPAFKKFVNVLLHGVPCQKWLFKVVVLLGLSYLLILCVNRMLFYNLSKLSFLRGRSEKLRATLA